MPNKGLLRQTEPEEMEGMAAANENTGQEASPEEQKAYETFVGNALSLVYENEKVLPAVIQTLQSGDPIESLGTAAANIITRLLDSAEEKGVPISDDILLHGSQEIVEDLADLSATAKIHTYTEQELGGAFTRAMDEVRNTREKTGKLNPDSINEDWQAIQQADQDGTLASMVGGAYG